VRRVILTLILFLAGLGAASPIRAGDELAMPFDCGLENGRLTLKPADERRYPIIGARDEQPVTACHSAGSSDCRTIMVHRFVISCGGAGVAWMRIAAAIKHPRAAPAWVENGQLNVVLSARGSGASVQRDCLDRPAFALAGAGFQRTAATGRNCASRRVGTSVDQLVLPAGFAPVGEMGAHLVLDTRGLPRPGSSGQSSSAPDSDGMAWIRPAAAAQGRTLVAKVEPGDIVAPIPGLEPYEAQYESAYSGSHWVTVVNEVKEPAAPRDDADAYSAPWAWMFAAMALATLVGLMRVRYADSWSGRFFVLSQRGSALWTSWFSGAGRHGDAAGASAVTAMLEQSEKVVSKLKGAGPLREVLLSELQQARHRLASVAAVAGEGEDADARAGMLYRALMRDLQRIRRIAESAAASLSHSRPHSRQDSGLPHTTSEAYDVLGVNPNVSEGVLKKIVDALRMSWHPDHARDEDDRVTREARIRQINVAWEMISANRAAA
jgi:DnaJ domain